MSERLHARHTVPLMGTTFLFRLSAPVGMSRREVGDAIAAAVGELRAVEAAFSPYREHSLVTMVRRGDLAPDSYPRVLLEVLDACNRMRALTDGWFDVFSVPGGFDPSGLVKGWAIERAGALLRRAGITDYAINGGGDISVRGLAPHGGPWRVGVRHPGEPGAVVMALELTDRAIATSGAYERGGHVVDPHTGAPAASLVSATVVGPDLSIADAYATALFAAGPAGLVWFPPGYGYDALVIDADLTGTYTAGFGRYREPAHAAA